MRFAAAAVIALSNLIRPVDSAGMPEIDPGASLAVVQPWIYNYRATPDHAHDSAAVRVLFGAQALNNALAAVEELKTKGSGSGRNLDFWGQVGVGAVPPGCIFAAAPGQVAVGIPCVIGGSASPGILSLSEKQQ